ncbi:MAG: hypothetical protein NVS3B5_19080 [Sphingomicrobium sp.]
MIFLSQHAPKQGPAIIRAFRSLTRDQAVVLAQAISSAPGKWSVDCHYDYDGYLSLMISSSGQSTPTILVSGTTDQIEIAELNEDDLRTVGRFACITAASAQLLRSLTG